MTFFYFFFSSSFFLLLIIWMLQHLTVFFLGREKKLANKIAELIEDKCKILEELSLCKKEVMLIYYF